VSNEIVTMLGVGATLLASGGSFALFMFRQFMYTIPSELVDAARIDGAGEWYIFHRIIKGFVCQGGDPTGSGRGGPGYRFADELPEAGSYELGSLAMANAGPDTNGSQFFIISGSDGTRLPPHYSLFGKVTDGLDVVDAMQKVPTARNDRPLTPVTINSVTITESD